MSKRLNAKYKCNRRYGSNIWGRTKSSVVKRDYPPGQHGPKGMKKLTGYGSQLAAKQKLKFFYGNLSELQFRNIFRQAKYGRGSTGDSFLSLLERRLDAFVVRVSWAVTPFAARQLINHGHVLVNGKKVNISSFRLSVDDVVSLKSGVEKYKVVAEAMSEEARAIFPDYISFEGEGKSSARLTRIPEGGEISYPFEVDRNKIIEFYSRCI